MVPRSWRLTFASSTRNSFSRSSLLMRSRWTADFTVCCAFPSIVPGGPQRALATSLVIGMVALKSATGPSATNQHLRHPLMPQRQLPFTFLHYLGRWSQAGGPRLNLPRKLTVLLWRDWGTGIHRANQRHGMIRDGNGDRLPDDGLDLLQTDRSLRAKAIDHHLELGWRHQALHQLVDVTRQVAQGGNVRGCYDIQLVAAADGGQVRIVKTIGQIEDNVLVHLGQEVERALDGIERHVGQCIPYAGRWQHVQSAGMMGDKTVQQSPVQSFHVKHQLIKVIACSIQSKVGSHMSQLPMLVHEEHPPAE